MKIIVDSLRSKILDCPVRITNDLYKFCSYRAHNYQFSEAYLSERWDGYVRKFSKRTNSFPSGLLHRVKKRLEEKEIKYEIFDKRRAFDWNEKRIVKNLNEFKLMLRPYQIDGLITGLMNPYMIYWWATSSGKTVLFSGLISALKIKTYRKTLILVTNRGLAAQHREEMESMLEEKIGLIEEGRFEPRQITVAVINTLFKRAILDKNIHVRDYLGSIEHLIVDECHHVVDSKMMKETIALCKNTVARHGFSGTPYSLTTDDMELECVTGPPLSKVSMTDLIENGWVSRPHIIMWNYEAEWMSSGAPYAKVYDKKIVNSNIRNKLIVEDIIRELKNIKIVLVLVRIIKHGQIIKEMLKNVGFGKDEVRFIHGSTEGYIREKTKAQMRTGQIGCVIASQIWNEGIDIPSIDVLVKADGGGGKEVQDGRGVRSVIQQIGRVIRKPVQNKILDVDTKKENMVTVYDYWDNVHADLARHSRNRYKTYKEESAFRVERKNR